MTGAAIRVRQRALIFDFIAAQTFTGLRVLDYGCGLQPHRELIEAAGGAWVGYNRSRFPGANAPDEGPDEPLTDEWDVIVCAQMLQYVPDPAALIARFRAALDIPRGRLVLTYATNWPEVETSDLWRFTRAGMEALLAGGWKILAHKRLGSVPFGDREEQAHGYGVTATPRKAATR